MPARLTSISSGRYSAVAAGFHLFVTLLLTLGSNVIEMRDEPLTIETSPGAGADTVVLRLQGPLTLSTLFSLQDVLRAHAARLTILDMSGVPYIDSAGLGTILMHYVSAEKNGRRLVLAGVSDRVKSLIQMTRVDSVLTLFPTVEAARQGI